MCVPVSVFFCVSVSVCLCVSFNVCVSLSPPVDVKISGCSLRATVWGVPKLVTRIASTTWDNNIFCLCLSYSNNLPSSFLHLVLALQLLIIPIPVFR